MKCLSIDFYCYYSYGVAAFLIDKVYRQMLEELFEECSVNIRANLIQVLIAKSQNDTHKIYLSKP